MAQGVFSFMDLIMGPIWLLLLYFLVFLISRRYKDPFLRKHFKWGFTIKLIGCIGFIVVYGFYYGNGDTFNYYRPVPELLSLTLKNPLSIFEILGATGFDQWQQGALGLRSTYGFLVSASSYSVIRFVYLFGLFTGGSYVAISFCFTFASYIGIWSLYRVVANLFPKWYRQLVIPVLYIPSVFLWGSGIMKDTIVLGLISLLTYAVYKIAFKHKRVLFSLLIIFFCLYILSDVKQYVLFTYVPMLLLWVFLAPTNRVSALKRKLLFPVLLLFFGLAVALLAPLMEGISDQYAIDSVLNTAENTADYIYRISAEKDGSAYSLGDIEYTPSGIVKVFPKAVVVTLFRPFLFEVRNPVMLLSALESTLFILATLIVLLKVGPFRYFEYITKNSFLLMSFLFSIFFSFAVGISTFNFGSLVRYKIPALIFYAIALMVPYYWCLDDKKEAERKQLNNISKSKSLL